MLPSAWLTLMIILLTTLLLVSNRFRADLIALLVLVTLGLTKLVSVNDALIGFSSSAVVTLLAISMITEGLQQTGISHWLGQQMKRLAGQGETRLLATIMLAGGTLSLFMNNIAAMAVLLPATKGLSRQKQVPLSRLLMPLSYGVIAGGMATIFTTSNLIIGSALQDANLPPLGMLDFFAIGAPLLLVTVLYMLVVGKRLLPAGDSDYSLAGSVHSRGNLLQSYRMSGSLWQVRVRFGSAMAGMSIREGKWRTILRLNILGITRDGKFISALDSDKIIREGDLLLAQGEPSQGDLRDYGVEILSATPEISKEPELEHCFSEIIVTPRSELVGKTLRESHFREKYHLTVMALWRAGKPLHTGFAPLPLQAGDGLLVQGTPSNLQMLRKVRDFILLDEDPDAAVHPQKAPL
ncbi:MAG: SLC13 family permease, partial [Anaerolineales bacterium]|nr:SLC13 family permease [Anaerolineales bacterium]